MGSLKSPSRGSVQNRAQNIWYASCMVNIRVLEVHSDVGILQKLWIERKLLQIELFGPDAKTILDLTDVSYADSTLVNALIDAHMQALHGRRVCVVASKCISRLFQITALDRLFPTFDNISSARTYASSHEFIDWRSIPNEVRFRDKFAETRREVQPVA
jgi:anti-anti-sigma factor